MRPNNNATAAQQTLSSSVTPTTTSSTNTNLQTVPGSKQFTNGSTGSVLYVNTDSSAPQSKTL